MQALWKPVATEEAFEIVRWRLFEPIKDLTTRDAVCRAFADAYTSEGAKLPSETHERRYYDRLCQAYPIHPEVFDRLYEDWTTIDGFQRTRGVLKLMAKVIYRLWQNDNKDLVILPGSIPLASGDVRNEMTYLLPPGWDPVIEGDIDGDRAETTELESQEPRFGQMNAARRVARTIFLGTAPASVATKPGTRGLDRGRILLGCLQPGQTSAVYSDALSRLADRLHYLNSSGDKAADTTRYWFDRRTNLRREMEDRKQRFDNKTDVRKKIEEVVKKLFAGVQPFDGVHVFTSHGDVPDDSALRLVILGPEQTFAKDDPRPATDAVLEYLKMHGHQPRHRANRLLFLAADHPVLGRVDELSQPDHGQGQVNEAQERRGELVVPRGDSTVLLQLSHQSLHPVPLPIRRAVQIPKVLPTRMVRHLGHHSVVEQSVADRVAVVGPVPDRLVHVRHAGRGLRPQSLERRGIAGLARGHDHPDRRGLVDAREVDLGRKASTGTPERLLRLPPFFAGAPAALAWARITVLSTNTRRTPSRGGPRAGKSVTIRSNIPAASHRRYRLYTASQAPYRSGSCRHLQPLSAR